VTLEEAWDFFSSPVNLKTITPDYMGFNITSDLGNGKMFAGQIITYKVTPLFNIPMNWVTEITHVVDHKYFVDEQRFGPYALWHHQHWFKSVNGV
jgi:ligand-binding SRPBCC domain-containing protein